VSALERYLAALWQGERSTATGVVLDLLGRGASPERIINDLLAEAQTIVGLEWHQGRLSIAGEHLATAITESVLHELGRVATRDLDVPTLGSRGQTAVTCGEGEWHTLPALMATTVLRLRGVHVAYVAPSVPADDLVEYLLHDGPTVVALTCSSTINLVGAWRSISALRAGGMTIVCAGRGFGPDGRWGWALGADQWAPDLIRGADRIQAAIDSRPAPPRAPQAETSVAHEILVLQRQHDPLLVAAVEAASTALPSLGQSDVARRSTRDRIEAILKVVAAAAIVGDPAVATEHVSWLEEGLQARQLPLDWASVGFDAVLDTLPAALVHTRAMALTGRAACSRTPTRPTRTRDRAPES
jgi:methanogenic corrinoid protein MtbC1